MELPRTRELLPRVIWRDSSPSTNGELRELAAEHDAAGTPLPHGTLLATAEQTAGRGRLDRGWVMPPGTAVATSVLVRGFGGGGSPGGGGRPGEGSGEGDGLGPGWLSLLAGSALATALQPLFGEGLRVGVKWPNDVHVRDEEDAVAGRPGRKLCGILCEMIDPGAVIVGAGINLLIPEWELPTERAASLLSAGARIGGDPDSAEPPTLSDPVGRALADRVIAAYAAELLRLVELAAEDPAAARARAARRSLTLRTEVRVHLPGGDIVDGRARELAADGALLVELPTGGVLTVSAGDVEHLR